MKSALVDAGPLIALFDRDDRYHRNTVDFMRDYSGRLITTWPVLTEVSYMLGFSVKAQVDFLEWVLGGAVHITNLDESHLESIIDLMKKYSDVPMDLADGSLMVVAGVSGIHDIVTIDSDYHIYRIGGKKRFANILQPYLNDRKKRK